MVVAVARTLVGLLVTVVLLLAVLLSGGGWVAEAGWRRLGSTGAGLARLAWLWRVGKESREDRLLADLHPAHALHRPLRRFLGFVVHEAVAARVPLRAGGDIARNDAAEEAKRVEERSVADARVQVLHVDVPAAAPRASSDARGSRGNKGRRVDVLPRGG